MSESGQYGKPWRAVVRANQCGPQMVAVDMPGRGSWKPTRDRLTDADVSTARLIAAAPDLLAACQEAITSGLEDMHPESVRIIQAAIAKAEGRS